MTPEEAKKQYGTIANALAALSAENTLLKREKFVLEAAIDLSLHQRRKAENQLYNYLNPIQKKDKEPA